MMTYDEIAALPDLEKVKAMAANGIAKRTIESLLGHRMTENEDQIFRRAQAERVLAGRTRRNAKSSTEAPLSGAERKRRSLEREASIDDYLDDAITRIDWPRRRDATDNVEQFLASYCMEPGRGLLDDPPERRLLLALRDMRASVGDDSTNYHVRVARGFGKTSLSEGVLTFAGATGLRKYVVIFSAAKPEAVQICTDIFNVFSLSETFAQDFPEIAVPLRWFGGSFKRRQMYNGVSTRVEFSQTRGFTLPTIIAKTDVPQLELAAGQPWPSSGVKFAPRGFSGHARGLKSGSTRPDLVLLDDLQDEEDAANAEVVAKNVRNIRRTILNLGGKRKISVLMTSTPIESGDLSETFAADPEWKTTTYRAFEAWPTEWIKRGMDGLWGEYIRTYRHALHTGAEHPREPATAFYAAHRAAMDEGADVLNEKRFDAKAGQISAVQALMDKYFEIGADAFAAEYQMQTRRTGYLFQPTPQIILSRVRRDVPAMTVPAGAVLVVSATDINPSYALSTVVTAFWPDRTAVVIGHILERISISDRVNDTAYNGQIYDVVKAHMERLAAYGLPIRYAGVDAGGKQFEAVTRLGASLGAVPFRLVPMVGRSEARQWNPMVRSRVADAVNNTVYCRDEATRAEWMAWNADAYKETAQRSWATETGAPGGLSLYSPTMEAEHEEFALQIANEVLESKRIVSHQLGRSEYKWKDKGPHDFGDCVAMCYALAGAAHIAAGGALPSVKRPTKRTQTRYTYVK